VIAGSVVAPAPQPEPASCHRSATRDVSFSQSEVRCQKIRKQPVQRYSEVFELGAKGQGFVIEVDFHLTFSFLVVNVEGCRHHFCSAEL